MAIIGQLPISEIFGPTPQGEGPSQGKRVIFIRTGFCNLRCGWCDTKYALDEEKYDLSKELTNMTHANILAEVKRLGPDVKSVVISGGEPMLHQSELITLLVLLKYEKYWVEIETNGTIEPKARFLELIDQINCSPKTKNSGPRNTIRMREKPAILKKYVACEKTNFKFVVCSEEDIPEIEKFIKKYKISKDRVRLMPQGQTRAEYFAIDIQVQRMAHDIKTGFTSRLQMYYHNNERGH